MSTAAVSTAGRRTSKSILLRHDLSNEQVIAQVREGLPFAELEALQAKLNLPMEALAKQIGMSRATIQRRKKNGGRLDATQSDRLVRLGRLLHKAVEVLDGEDNARLWLTSPQRGLGGETPLHHADTGIGAREVENLLGRIQHGVFS